MRFGFALLAVPSLVIAAEATPLAVSPQRVTLHGVDARMQLLVDGGGDLTAVVEYRSEDPSVASVSPNGVIRAVADGTTRILVRHGGKSQPIAVSVQNAGARPEFQFENDVMPLLSRYGCNSSGCHGKAEGQNGFKLSVFGFDPQADWRALTQEGRGRRIFRPVPERSLLLQKASGGVPHGGGVRVRRASPEYRLLRDWIAAGAPFGSSPAPRVESIHLEPRERLMAMKAVQQLRVVARWSNGRTADVTHLAKFQSNSDTIATVDEFGRVTSGDAPGDAAVMASFMGAVDVFRAVVPRNGSTDGFPKPPVHNFIDKLVDERLAKLNIAASGLCSDADYLRRVYLDVIGTLPTAEEARRFLTDKRQDRRSRLVNELLKRTEFADFWALKWSDLLHVNRQSLGHKGAYQYYRWIRDSFAAGKPYDQFARELLTAEGDLNAAPAGHLYKVVAKPGQLASTVSQVLLGVRIECAQCHHHPFDRWSQTDYFGMQAYFTQTGFKPSPRGDALAASKNSTTKHPRTGEVVYAHPLGTTNPKESPAGDRRRELAAWMTSASNPWFARNLVNRVWADMLGRGLVEPVDDFRSTNPPTNGKLLDELAAHFVQQNFDVRSLIRTIAASRTYQLSNQPNDTNRTDERNYSRALFRQLPAEVLLDAVCQTTGVAEKFKGLPAGYRAIQLWDSHSPHYFLKLFGRPVRATACECERSTEPSVAQVLHVLNSPQIHAKLSHEAGRIAELESRITDDGKLVDELYLTFYSRFPSPEERRRAVAYLKSGEGRRPAAEDLAWTMLNTVEFLFNH